MTRVLLIYGGRGSEHDVSLMSAENVGRALGQTDFEIEKCLIGRDGTWQLSFDEIRHYDVIFPLIHGQDGEDGRIAALGDLLDLPVVGCGVSASVLAWDKDLCKEILRDAGVPVVPWRTLRDDETPPDYAAMSRELDSEILFVKPAREGSSVGVSRAANATEFDLALAVAFEYDDKILVEPAIVGRELECAALGNAPDVTTTDLGEVKPPDNDFYSYDEKYSAASHTDLDIPAGNLSDGARAAMQNYAKQAFTLIGGRGLSRIDFFYDEKTDQVFLNEINTMPGFTNISMYPKLWEKAGLTYTKLLEKLIELAQRSKDS
jgi:D-alanine-D-alanine ligase